LVAASGNFALLLTGRALVGLVYPAIAMAMTSMVADLYPADQRGRAYMLMSLGCMFGVPLAFAAGGVLMSAYATLPNGWRWTMLWVTSPLIPTLLALLALREPHRASVVAADRSVMASFRKLWLYRAQLIPLLVSMILVAMVVSATMVWTVPALSRTFGVGPDRSGALMGTATLVSGLLGPSVGGLLADLSQRTGGLRRTVTLMTGLAFLSAPAGLFALVPNLLLAGCLLVLLMILANAMIVVSTVASTVVVPNELRGLYLALVSTVSAPFSQGLAPLTVSFQSAADGRSMLLGKALASACLVLCATNALTLLLGRIRVFK
jgi:MFS family permease